MGNENVEEVFYSETKVSKKTLVKDYKSYIIFSLLGFGIGFLLFYIASHIAIYFMVMDIAFNLSSGMQATVFMVTLLIFSGVSLYFINKLIKSWIDDKIYLTIFQIAFGVTYLLFFILRLSVLDFSALV